MSINIRPEVQQIAENIITTRRDIHKHPELSFKEFRTAKLVAEKLKSLGILVKEGVGKTGVLGDIKGDLDGPAIALRADMDALPIQETGDVPYKSINDGIMHACGHDAHVAMLLGTAEIISQQKHLLKGCVRFIFQPAEEGLGGARFMIADGALDGVDQIYGAHVWNYQQSGTIGIRPGPFMAAADEFEMTINGKGGHGAAPQGTQDAIVIASHLIQTFQTIVSRNTNPIDSTVVSVGKINGGYNFNIIADKVTLSGTTRAYTEENRQLVKSRMKEIILGTEKTFNCKIELVYKDGYPPTINEDNCAKVVLNASQKIVGENAGEPYLSMGAEDFSYFLNEKPGAFFFVGSAPKDREPMSTPHHCSHFDIDENALLIGTSTFVQIIEDLLISDK